MKMLRRFFITIFTVLVLTASLSVTSLADDIVKYDGLGFNKTTGTVLGYQDGYLTQTNLKKEKLIIPEYIEGVKVIGIANGAFSGEHIKELFLPEGITHIGTYAFNECEFLVSVQFPDSLKSIGNEAFSETGLQNVVLPDGLETIGDRAFYDSYLQTINIPASVTYIGKEAFGSVSNVFKLTVAENGNYKYEDGVMFTKDMKEIVLTTNSVPEEYAVPEGVEKIGGYAFQNQKIKSIVIPDTVLEIGEGAFYNCSLLENVRLPHNIKAIEASTFSFCESLKNIKIPNSVLEIGKSAFHSCTSLESIHLPNNIKIIAPQTFAYCESLKSIVIPNGVTTIDYEAFNYCKSLKTMYLPKSLEYIECYGPDREWQYCALSGCNSLSDVYYAGTKDQWNDFLNLYWYDYYDSGYKKELSYNSIVLRNATLHLSSPFIDINDDDKTWYTDGVLYCHFNGYMVGTGTVEFNSKGNVNRAMFATILAKIDGAEISEYAETSFTDVPAGQWYSNAIEWAYRNGYTAGLDRGIFGRKYPVTREQLATFLYTYSEKKGYDVSDRADIGAYTDHANVSDYALEAMKWAVSKGVISGTDKRELLPKDSITRAQMAVVIKSFVENIIPVKVD